VHDAHTRANQVVFREVNERIAQITRAQREQASDFLCECGRDACLLLLQLELNEYEEIRRSEKLFIAAPGHSVDGIDRLFESRDGFDLVEQI
jgi:hypothetical protein